MATDLEVFRGAVSVTPTPPLDSATGYLFYYAAIHPVAVAQSVVLSSILESSGDAQLPSSVSLPEFELWQKAVVDREVGNKDDRKAEMDIPTVCAVLKAADGVGDSKFDHWVELAWGLMYNMLTQSSTQLEAGNAAIDCLFTLPDHIQHLIFAVGARRGAEDRVLALLLRKLPHSIHSRILSAFTSPTKMISAPGPRIGKAPTISFFQALASLPADPPSVLGLDDPELSDMESSDDDCDDVSAAAAAALRHHSGLTSLNLSQVCSSAGRMQHLAPAIGALTDLKTLQLGAAGAPVCQTSLAILPDAFQSSQRLHSLTLHVRSTKEATLHSIRSKSRRVEAHGLAPGVPASLSETVIRLLSHLTCLTYLQVTSSYVDSADTANVRFPINMPHLQALRLSGMHSAVAVNIASNLVAPLKVASIEFHGATSELLQCPEQLCGALQTFVHLTSLSLQLHLPSGSNRKAVGEQASSMFSQLHKLQHLEIITSFRVLVASIPAVTTDLTKLSLTVKPSYYAQLGDEMGEEIRFTSPEWERVCAAISQMALRHLAVELPFRLQVHQTPGLACLSSLTCLTALALDHWGTCLRNTDDRAALSHMSQLQSLSINGIRPDDAFLPSVRDALASLPQLHELTLRAQYDHDSLAVPAAAAVQKVPDGCWQGLTSLALPVLSWEAAQELIQSALRLTALVSLRVQAAVSIRLPQRLDHELGVDMPLDFRLEFDGFQSGYSMMQYHAWDGFDGPGEEDSVEEDSGEADSGYDVSGEEFSGEESL